MQLSSLKIKFKPRFSAFWINVQRVDLYKST